MRGERRNPEASKLISEGAARSSTEGKGSETESKNLGWKESSLGIPCASLDLGKSIV